MAHEVVSEVVAEVVGASERRLTARIDGIDGRLDGIDGRLDGIDGRLDGIDGRLDGIDRRLDGLEGKVDHLAEVTDLRLAHLEADMTLVKQHLLGSSAA